MWVQAPVRCSRQALDVAGGRGSHCSCQAKRYVPASRQRKAASGGPSRPGGAGRKPLTDVEPADPEDLLRELNSGGAGWLRDEEEQDWGLDDVAEHARARQQKQLLRFGKDLPAAAAATRDVVGGVRIGGRRRGGGDADVATHGSPLESGLASISTNGDDGDDGGSGTPAYTNRAYEDRSKGSDGAGGGVGRTGAGLAAREGLAAAAQGRTVVELEASYARRNPEIMEALRLRGVAVRVRQPAGGGVGDDDDDGDLDDFGIGGVGSYSPAAESEDFGLSDEDDSLDLRLDSGLASAEDGAQAAPSGSRDWYGSLAAAGFAVRTNAAGEVFLERTVRRRAAPGAEGATGASSAAAAAAKKDSTAPPRSVAPAAAASAPPPAPGQVVVSALEPITGRPAIVAALQRLTTPQQVLDFLELSYTQWAANGYRLVDMHTGRPVAAPSPAEAAHCLRALAVTARRAEIGGWRCLELAAGRQAQGLAEALRVTPPRLLPEQSTPQLSAAYFDAARRFWLDSAADPIIDDPRVGRARAAAAAAAAPAAAAALATGGEAGAERGAIRREADSGASGASSDASAASTAVAPQSAAAAAAEDAGLNEEYGFSTRATPSSDQVYDSLVAKYTAISQHKQRLDMARGGTPQPQQPQPQQPQPQPDGQGLKRLALPAAAAAEVATAPQAGDKVAGAAGPRAQPSNAVPSPPPPACAAAAEAGAEASVRRAAKIECLVSALWGLSSLGGPPYFQAETEAAVTILVRCLASATAAAAAAAPPQPPGVAASAAVATAAAPGGLTGWQAGQVVWALGNSRHVTPRLADLETSILRSGGLSAMQPRDVTRVLWGFASLGHRPERLLLTIRPDWAWRERMAAPVVPEQGRAGGGVSRQRRRGKARGKRAGGIEARGDVRCFSPQQLAGAVWALAVMEQVDTGPFRSAWAELLRRAPEVPPAEPILTQIWQANLAIHLESTSSSATSHSAGVAPSAAPPHQGRYPAAVRKGGGVPTEDLMAAGLAAAAVTSGGGGGGGGGGVDAVAARGLLVRARDVFLSATSGLRRRVQSGYQRQMANSLTGLRLMHLLEDNSAGYSIDITLPQLRIALEADGPTHTSRTPGGAVLGATAMKRRHLQRLGWHVVNVTYKEWDKLTSESARRAFLQERINDALLSNVQLTEDDGDPVA